MKNKYLTKVALFGFSDKEKRVDRMQKYMVDSYNLYGNHFNKHIGEINKRHKLVKTPEQKAAYSKDIQSTLHPNPEFKAAHKVIHAKYSTDMAKLGIKVADHDTDFEDLVNWVHKSDMDALGK